MRGFKIAAQYQNSTIELPKRGTQHSAGYDFAICKDITIKPNQIVLAETGIKAYMQNDEVLQIYPRSSLPRKYHLTIPNNVGIIDADYYENPSNDGAIYIQLLNFGTETITLKRGTRIAQGIFTKYLCATDEPTTHTKRNGGFGSTG